MDVFNNINVQVEMFNENALRIYMYPEKYINAWEMPDEALAMDIPRKPSIDKLYNVSFTTEPVFGVVVERITNSTVKTKIIDTTVTGTIFSRQFMQLTTRLSSGHVYGFGEHNHRRFKHDMDWKTWPIFTRDVAPVDEWNLYGAHPVYLNLEEDGKANMVFLKNSHAMGKLSYVCLTYISIGRPLWYLLKERIAMVKVSYECVTYISIGRTLWCLLKERIVMVKVSYECVTYISIGRPLWYLLKERIAMVKVSYECVTYISIGRSLWYLLKERIVMVKVSYECVTYISIGRPLWYLLKERIAMVKVSYECVTYISIGRTLWYLLKERIAMVKVSYECVTYISIGRPLWYLLKERIVMVKVSYECVTYISIGRTLWYLLKERIVMVKAIGKPLMPPYWSLGFHLCKWGYENLTVVQDVVERNRMAEISQDVQWGDIDYMFNKFDFTVDKKTFKDLPEFVDELHQNGQKYVIIVDVGIGANETIIEQGRLNSPGYEMYKDGIDMNVFVKNHDDTVLKGKVWPGLTAFPDFSHTNATDYWIKYIKYFYDTERVKVDGLWIDMNEPASFVQGSINGCINNTLNYPPYVPHILDGHTGSLYYKTICMDSKQKWGNHYAVHSLYGHAESIVTYRAMTTLWNKTRPFIMTRSSFAGTGKYSFKWLGDNQSQWRQIPWSIIGILEFSMFGFPMIGADICGFWYAAQYEMCLRWSQLGAFYPFARNHNAKGWPHQDPAKWGEGFTSIARRTLHIRYKILPYLYTQFHLAHTTSSMVARPLVFEFPEDKQTRDVDRQFLLGPAFLVTPVLEQGKSSVEGYFPKQRWYNYYDGTEFAVSGQRITVDAPLPIIPLHLRGGYILPTQQPANTTVYSRQRPMGLIVAFDEDTSAKGELFWDDGDSIDSFTRGEYLKAEMSATKGKYLEYKVVKSGYEAATSLFIDTIELYGLFGFPERVIVDSVQIPTSSVRSKEKTKVFVVVLIVAVLLITAEAQSCRKKCENKDDKCAKECRKEHPNNNNKKKKCLNNCDEAERKCKKKCNKRDLFSDLDFNLEENQ
ncbi:Probable maltase-glucoamylase 2,Alpha-glucosidase,Sucrase-isomaltase, intestinal,Lysosomal alpha-glucosidase,Probable alpha-glucosidase Os06g0675700,Maltase-glucoamylase, intestinal [Mytilus coruscus]|uniref:Probable maltase-glucoamylase 2,Alpha-glucosidase,Sucrase-isomaltase, intestinal,Lysosomal alpha-glucosidase,Probable alpha-glucosidase Os06g0675700,Maltase-glucoamylase, intestinal n=1 Tax=Mytilus coruscus TaxID=42192 RepID=A0A6J8DC76_MYTCO|nr:Probable maltase-glucoamylase 2,Alpha-glucosidase,Sucrase-isomaltase, intestinal,Lysosomal alpha-glucosidase,Probable alpha-glucosidase Os06g0675700,Maltase-glucoamylase, intestinal [Mytilus coruscus]